MKRLTSSILLGLSLASPVFARADANVATEKCQELKGKHLVLIWNGEEWGFCQLGTALIEEWTLWGATTQGGSVKATRGFLNHIPPQSNGTNPSSFYCSQLQGQILVFEDEEKYEYGICHFSDGSAIEQETLFAGPEAEGTRDLAQVLRESDRHRLQSR